MSTTLPGPRGLPLVGVLFPFARDPLAWLETAARRWGDVVAYPLGPFQVVQLNSPADIEAVLVGEASRVIKDMSTRDLQLVVGQGLLTAEHDAWRVGRRRLAPFFQRAKVARYAPAVVAAARARAEALRPGETDAHPHFSGLAFDIVMEALFSGSGRGPSKIGGHSQFSVGGRSQFSVGGHSPREGLFQRINADVETLMTEYNDTIQSWPRMFPEWVPFPGRRRFAEAVQRLHRVTTETLVEAARGAPAGTIDLASHLLDVRLEDGASLSVAAIRDEVLTMILAGHETTALALTYATWALAHDLPLQERVAAEAQEALAHTDTPELDRLPLTTAVFRETLRLYPPAWVIGREVVEPFTLPSGVRLAAGVQLFLPQWIAHRDPRWWRDPLAFRPDRFLSDDGARPRFAYFPFGGGPRVCIGNHFAELEGVLALATLLRRVRLLPVRGATLRFAPSITLRPSGPVKVCIAPRNP